MISAEMLEIIGPALAAGLLIALVHAPLGMEVLRRGIIFIDLAIAQIAGLGVVATSVIWDEPVWWIVQSAALSFALIAALLFYLVEHYLSEQQEAIIGCSFVLAASAALLLLADHPHGGEEIQHLLSGQILFVTWKEVWMQIPVYGLILAFWFAWPMQARKRWFYLLFAVTVTSSVQLVGVYVVFASFILPALSAVPWGQSYKHIIAWICGIVSALAGVLVATFADVAAGPVIVLVYALVALVLASGSSVQVLLHRKERGTL